MAIAWLSRTNRIRINIGFYRVNFHVLPKTSAPTTATSERAEVKLGRIHVEAASRKLGQKVEVSAMLRGGEESVYGVPVYFYDGDPQAGGRLFDIERLAFIRAGGRHKVSIRFRPQDCGEHQIYVTVGKGRDYEVTGAFAHLQDQVREGAAV